LQAATKEGLSSSGGMAPLVLDPYELNEPLQRAGALMYAVDEYPELSDAARRGFTDLESLLNAVLNYTYISISIYLCIYVGMYLSIYVCMYVSVCI